MLGADVPWPDNNAVARTREALADGPQLGRLGELAVFTSAACANPATAYTRVHAVLFAAQPDPRVQTLAESLEVGLQYLPSFRVRDIAGAITLGIELADDAVDSGADLLIAAYPTTSSVAAVVSAVLTDTEPVKVLARGRHAIDPDRWMASAVEVRDSRRTAMAFRHDPTGLLESIRNPFLAAAAAYVLQAAVRRTPVLLDGPGAAAAALVASQAQPRAVRWWLAADSPSDPAHDAALTALALVPILTLGTSSGDGTAGLLAVPVLRSASAYLPGGDLD